MAHLFEDLLLRLANATRDQRIAWWRTVKHGARP